MQCSSGVRDVPLKIPKKNISKTPLWASSSPPFYPVLLWLIAIFHVCEGAREKQNNEAHNSERRKQYRKMHKSAGWNDLTLPRL
uniref:Uncharacterized protein n=1 Tax=Anopheles quadriannulatus TaxID=34691 RepID=A0A182X617_ANOQN